LRGIVTQGARIQAVSIFGRELQSTRNSNLGRDSDQFDKFSLILGGGLKSLNSPSLKFREGEKEGRGARVLAGQGKECSFPRIAKG